MPLQKEIEVMQAHCTNMKQRKYATWGAPQSRPVHVYLLHYNDKQYVLRNTASKLKDNLFQEVNLLISDVSKSVREERKTLKEIHQGEICK